jgi:hypothetical protein
MTATIHQLRPNTVTITKKQYRAICDALINSANLMPQLLAISTDGGERSNRALYQAQNLLQTIERQLTEATKER